MLKVGLIGLGFMGTQHANCYKNIPGVELAALADIRVENAKALAAIEEALTWLKKRTNDRADRGVLGHEVK